MKKYICQIYRYIIENQKTRTCCVCNTSCEKFKELNTKQNCIINLDENIVISKESEDNIIYDLSSIF